jgi:hypothetical protein
VNEEGGIVRGGEGVHPSMVVHLRKRGRDGRSVSMRPKGDGATKQLK